MRQSRRKFITRLAYTGLLSSAVSPLITLATSCNRNQKLKAKKGMVFLFQGDSITDGNRGRNSDPNHIMGHGYAFAVAAQLGADYPAMDFNFYNRGVSGNTILDMAARWQRDTLDLKPDLLSILIGVNDSSSQVFPWGNPVTVKKYEETYERLLSLTKEKYPDILFVLGEPFILKVGMVDTYWEAYRTDIEKRQSIVRKLSEQYDAVFVGFQEMFNQACSKAPADYWLWDGIHPSVAGHELMAREWLKQVEKAPPRRVGFQFWQPAFSGVWQSQWRSQG